MRTLLMLNAVLGVVALCAGIASWVAMVVFTLKALRRTRPEARLWSKRTLFNPMNALLFSDFLTEEGLQYRRKLIWATIAFLLCCGIIVVVNRIAWNR